MTDILKLNSSMFVRLLITVSLLSFLILSLSDKIEAEDNGKYIISDIIINKNHYVKRDEVIDMMGIKIGQPIDYDVITNEVKSMFLKGLFTDIKVSIDPVGAIHELPKDQGIKSVRLLVDVHEREFISSIIIEGNELLRRDKIRELFDIKEGMVFYEKEVVNATNKLLKQIEKLGFKDAQVSSEIIKKEGSDKVKIKLNIVENKPLTIAEIVILGDETIKKLIGSYLKISTGDIYNGKVVNENIQSMIDKLKEKGYYRVQIDHEYIEDSRQLVLDVNIEHRLDITFNGNNNISKTDLFKQLLFFEFESANRAVIERSIDKMIKLYHRDGYYNVEIGYNVTDKNDVTNIAFSIKEGTRCKISTIIIKGNTLDRAKIKNALSLKEGEPYNPDYIDEDKNHLIALYKIFGFRDITIEGFTPVFFEDNKKAAITITIKEGLPIIIEGINIEGNTVLTNEKLLSLIGIKTGSNYNEDIAINARHIISSEYTKLGYADVNVTHITTDVSSKIQLIFEISEGKRYTFGSTIIKGNEMTNYSVFKTAIKHKRGDPYDYNVLLNETIMLNKTGLFKSVNIRIIQRPDNVNDVVFEVEEADRWLLQAGFGYAEYVGFRGFIDLGYKNLFGGNRQIRVRAEGNELSQIYSVNYLEPWFLPSISFRSFLSFTHLNDENIDTGYLLYTMDKFTGSAGIEHPITKTLKVTFFYELSHVSTFHVQPDVIISKEDTGTLLISSAAPSIILDTRDNPFNPRDGIYSGLTLKFASPLFLSETNFLKLSGYYNEYVGIFDHLTLALSFRSGAAYCIGQTIDLPLIERFFLGGMNTIRGFKKDEVGPKGENGSPTGGNFFGLINIEARVDIGYGIGLVFFSDIGDVWLNSLDIDLAGVRKTAGTGIRYMTPVGPFRLDYGHKLDRRPGEDLGEFHFSLGNAF